MAAYLQVWAFPNGKTSERFKLYVSDDTAIAGSKKVFAKEAQPGEAMTVYREGGDVVATLKRPLVIEGKPFQCDDCPQLKECTQYGCVRATP